MPAKGGIFKRKSIVARAQRYMQQATDSGNSLYFCYRVTWAGVKAQGYNPPTTYLFLEEKRKIGIVKRIQKQNNKFDLTNHDCAFATT